MQLSYISFRERVLAIQIARIERPRGGFEDVLALPLIQFFFRGEVGDKVILLLGSQRVLPYPVVKRVIGLRVF
jgi:hypothetical protein